MVNISPQKTVARAHLKAERDQYEERVQAALLALSHGQFKDIKAAAAHHSIPYTTLYNRKHGRKSRSEAFKDLQALPPEAEEVLVRHIGKQANFGFPVTPQELKHLAEQLLRQHTYNNDAKLGRNWVATFRQRHPDLRSYYSRVMDAQRVRAGDPKVVEAYFDLLAQTIQEYNIVPENIYNMDETGFLIGQSQTRNIIVPKENSKNKRFRSHPGTRETITVVECIGARGTPPPPMVIYQGKSHQQGWYRDFAAAKEWVFAISPNGWTDNDLAQEWLRDCFDKHTKQKAAGRYRLLILDGHGSHVTLEFIQQAWESRIVCLCLPPHATHLLQPLDVSIFGPLQNAFTQEVDKYAGANLSIGKKDFLRMYIKARESITGRAAAKAFKDVGIDSDICREIVLVRMPTYQQDCTPPPSSTQPEETPTPSTSAEAKQLWSQIFESLSRNQEEEQAALDSAHRQQRLWLRKCNKFMDRIYNEWTISEARNQELTTAHSNKRNALPGDRNQLSKARVLHASDLPRLLAERAEEARKEAEKQARKASGKKKAPRKSQGKGKQRAADTEIPPPPSLMRQQEPQQLEEEEAAGSWWQQPPPPFPGYDRMLGLPPLPPPSFASSSSNPMQAFPTWPPPVPYQQPMPPFM